MDSLMVSLNGDNGDSGLLPQSGFVGRLVSPYTSTAMLSVRDGIVGTWTLPETPSDPLPPLPPAIGNLSKQMARWERRVRSHIIAFDLISSLQFDENNKTLRTTIETTRGEGSILKLTRPIPENIFRDQMKHVRSYADLRRDRHPEIMSQLSNLPDFFGTVCFLHPERTRFTIELIAVLMRALVAAEMRVKHALASPRPVEYSPQVMPMIQTPGHSSFPSGHAVESFMLAHVLAELLETAAPTGLVEASVVSGVSAPASLRGQLMWLAARIATNRVVAGVHFPVDNAAGMVLGSLLGRYFVALATGKKGSLASWTFDATKYGADDFRWRDMLRALENGETSLAPENGEAAFLTKGDDFELKPLPSESPVRWLWDRAVEEWQKPL